MRTPRLLLLLLLALPLLAARVQPGERIRVMTYNIHAGKTAQGKLNLAAIAEVIRSARADVVGLQEVDRHWSARSDFADEAKELADRLGMHYYYAPIYDLPPAEPGRAQRQYGLAILSRFPITARQNHRITRLPEIPDLAKRDTLITGFPGVTLDVNGTPLHFFDTHLDFRGDPFLRTIEVLEMMRVLSDVQGPMVLLGDFNAPPGAAELKPLEEAFTEAWEAKGEGPGLTFPSDEPVKRIDHIYLSPGIRVKSISVPETLASDHRPVVAEIVLPSTAG